jgi:hypothetical protein
MEIDNDIFVLVTSAFATYEGNEFEMKTDIMKGFQQIIDSYKKDDFLNNEVEKEQARKIKKLEQALQRIIWIAKHPDEL